LYHMTAALLVRPVVLTRSLYYQVGAVIGTCHCVVYRGSYVQVGA